MSSRDARPGRAATLQCTLRLKVPQASDDRGGWLVSNPNAERPGRQPTRRRASLRELRIVVMDIGWDSVIDRQVTALLNRRVLQSNDTMHRAIEAVGGLYIVPAMVNPREVRSEIIARDIKALEIQGRNLEFIRSLPLEFLMVNRQLEPLLERERRRLHHLAVGHSAATPHWNSSGL